MLLWYIVSLFLWMWEFILTRVGIIKSFPKEMQDRRFFQFYDAVVKFAIGLPMKVLQYCRKDVQIWWIRHVLNFLMRRTPFPRGYKVIQKTEKHYAGVPTLVFTHKTEPRTDFALIFVHGGSGFLFQAEHYDNLTLHLAMKLKCPVFAFSYRLAPEYPFPAGVEDCENACAAILNSVEKEYGVPTNNVVISGDSAGASFAAGTVNRLLSRADPLTFKAQVLIYPLTQMFDLRTPSYQRYEDRLRHSAVLGPEQIARAILLYLDLPYTPQNVQSLTENRHLSAACVAQRRHYVGHHLLPPHYRNDHSYCGELHADNADQELSKQMEPLLGNPSFCLLAQDDEILKQNPPTLIATVEYDVLRDDGALFAKRLKDVGVPVQYLDYEAGAHGVINLGLLSGLSMQIRKDVINFVLESAKSV